MKKNLILGVTLCALVVTGCSSLNEAESGQPEQGAPVNVTINATREETPSTRTEYEEGTDKLIVKWNKDKKDKLGIFTSDNGTNSNVKFGVKDDLSADGKSANFSGTLTITDPGTGTTVYGYYPYSGTAGFTSTAIPINLGGQAQDGISSEVSLAHLSAKDYLAATPVTKKFSDGDQSLSLAFNPLLTILSFEIKQAMNVNFIRLEAVGDNNKTPFYTDGTVDITKESFDIAPGTATNAITLNVTNGQITTSGMFNMMIFPIESGKMPAKFKVTVTTTDGKVYTQTKDAPKNGFVRGKRSIMLLNGLAEETADASWDGSPLTANDAYPYSGGGGDANDPFQIATAKDLAQLAVNVNAGSHSSKNFILMKNIDLNKHEWTPIGNVTNKFQGTFDGGGKVITGMEITKYDTSNNTHVGLFGYVNGGTIKNINVAGEITINVSSATDIYAGGISGYCYDATLSGNLTSHVNIRFTNTNADSGFLRIGGVTGHSNTNGGKTVANVTLVNDGTLRAEGPAEVNVGGVIGYVGTDIEQSTTLINSGAVSGTSSGKTCRVGGLIGYSNNAVTCNGTNTGSVMGQISGGTRSVYSGGFIGYAYNTVKIDSSRNTGTVKAENNSATGANSYAGIRVGGSGSLAAIENANKDADGNPGSTDGVTATAANGKSYVNGVETQKP